MPTLSPQTTPFYGGGQVQNPANVIRTNGAPSTKLTEDNIGTIAVDNAAGVIYGLASKSGGVDTWTILGGGTGALASLTGDTGTAHPVGGNIKISGTANEITSAGSGSTITLTLPAAVTFPGSATTTTTLTAGTGITASSGDIVATTGNIESLGGFVSADTTVTAGTAVIATLGDITAISGNLVAINGNLDLNTAGNKININDGANGSVGTTVAMGGTPGTITVATTAVTSSSQIFISRNTPGGTLGNLSVPQASIVNATHFVINSDANETSTINWLIIN